MVLTELVVVLHYLTNVQSDSTMARQLLMSSKQTPDSTSIVYLFHLVTPVCPLSRTLNIQPEIINTL